MKQHTMREFSSGHGFLEAPRWHDGQLWASDFFNHHVVKFDADGGYKKVLDVPTSPSGLGFLADGSLLVVSQADKKVLRVASDGAVSEYADISQIAAGIANDMHVTEGGHAYVGNFGFDLGNEDPVATHLAHIDPQGNVSEVPGEVLFPNGSGIHPDGKTFLVAETFKHRVTAYDLAGDGTLSNQRVWAQLTDNLHPDGIAIDADGGVWIANALTETDESGFYRVVEGGEITDVILVPDAWAVAATFGGPDLATLYLVCNATTLADFAENKSKGSIRTADVGKRGVKPTV